MLGLGGLEWTTDQNSLDREERPPGASLGNARLGNEVVIALPLLNVGGTNDPDVAIAGPLAPNGRMPWRRLFS